MNDEQLVRTDDGFWPIGISIGLYPFRWRAWGLAFSRRYSTAALMLGPLRLDVTWRGWTLL